MSNVESKKTQVYAVVKITAALLVVLGHATVMYTDDGAIPVSGSSRFLAAVTEFIYNFHMPLFFFVTGCVYGHGVSAGKYGDSGAFLINKARRLLLPYLSVGFFYVAPVMRLLGLTDQSFFFYLADGILLSRNPRHLWFLPALFLIFMLAAFVKPITSRYPYIPLAAALVLHIAVRHAALPIPGVFRLWEVFVYAVYFAAGTFSDRYMTRLLDFFRSRRVASVFLSAVCAAILFMPDEFIPDTFAAAAGIFLLLYASFCAVEYGCVNRFRVTAVLNRDAFGIYLFHPMINYIIFYFLGRGVIPPTAICAASFLISTGGAVVITEVLRKIRFSAPIGEHGSVKTQK